MQEEVRVVLDAMGGDHAPEEMIKGAVEAVNEKNNIHVLLVGQEDVISEELEKYTYPKERMEIVHASEVIETAEPPVMAIRKKKDSSIVVGMNMVKLERYQGFSADLAGAICLLYSSLMGVPVSTTHTKTSAIMGVGAVKRLSAINFSVVKDMMLTWIFTFPGCGLISFCMENLLFSGFNVNIVNILGFYALLRKERQCTRRNFSDRSE
jgi:hypothetical protein